jgi:hypothetical protein
MEKWKTIPGFSRYQASTTGELRSLNYKNSGKIKELKPAIGNDGYLKTMLQDDHGNYKSLNVHTFIALAYYGPKPEGFEIDHLDCDKQNNRLMNLEYVTRGENMRRGYANGLISLPSGEDHHSAKLTADQVAEIREYVKNNSTRRADGHLQGYGRKALAEKYGITEGHLKDIINRRRDIWK